nr:hypothetical protein [Tanacetum cinerariifolium]
MMASFFQMNTASTSGSGPLPSNTFAKSKGELESITTRSGLVLDGPFVPMPPPFINPEEDERVEETLMNPDLTEYTIKFPPPLVQKAKPLSQRNYVTARALIDVHGEEMILQSINMINIYNDSYEDYLEDLFATNHISGNPTFSSHLDLTSLEVINPLSGSTTFSSHDHLLEKFADVLALITFPPGNDDLPFDIESNPREIEYLLNHDPSKEMDSILEDSIYEDNLAEPNDNLVNTIPEMFTDEHTLDYSSPLRYDVYDDDLVEFESDNDDVYDDPVESIEDKIKEPKLLIDDPPRSCYFLSSPEYDSFLFKYLSEVDALPSTHNEDKVFNSELSGRLVRAATTASSLEAEQDSGNITKTQSKATPSESSSQGTNSGGGPRCQETMRDNIAQTRFENISKHSNDLLFARGNILRSDDNRLKLNELMKLCTNLQNRVLDLEKIKTTQRNKIVSLKIRVKKLEKRNRSRTHKLKRLYKVGLSGRVESSGDKESLGDDASKQKTRIDAIDADNEITLVNDADNEMFDVDDLGGEEVLVARQNDNVAEEVVNAAQVSTAATTTPMTTEEITLAQALNALRTSKPKVKGIVFQEPCKSTTTTIISSQQSHDKGKGIMIEEPVKPKKKDQTRFDEEAALKLQEKATLFQQLLEKRRKQFAAKRSEEKRNKPPTKAQQRKIIAFRKVNTFEDFIPELVEGKEKRAGEELEQEITKKQKVEDDKEKAELKQLMETIQDEEEVAIDAIPLAIKSSRIVN